MRTPDLFSPSPVEVTQSLTPRMMGRLGIRVGEGGAYGLAFALGVLALGPPFGYHIASSYRGEMASWQARQSSVAYDHAKRLSDWLNERQAYAELFSTRPSVPAVLRAYHASGHLPGGSRGGLPDLTAVLDEMVRLYPYSGVYVLDREAQVVAQSSRAVPLNPVLAAACRAAVRARVMRIDLLGDAPDKTLIGFSVPVFPEPGTAEARPSPGQPLGVAALVFDAAQTMFTLVAREGVPTRTAETVLIRREGNDVVYFSPLRHTPASSLNLRFSLSTAPLPARAALEGRETAVESTDYRGVAVLTATRRIPLTGWGLVNKIDRDEALEGFHRQAIAEGLAAGLLVILLAGLLIFHRRHVLARVMKQEGEKFRDLLESAPDSIVISDQNARIELVNQSVVGMFGYEREELMGKPAESLLAEESRGRFQEQYARFLLEAGGRHKSRTFELTGLRKDGSRFPAEIGLSMLRTREKTFIISAIRGMTERKEAEQHLAQMEGRYRGLLEAAPDAMVVVKPGGEIVLLNLQAEKQFGYCRDELVGKNVKSIIPEGFAERLIADALRSAEDALAQQMGTGIELTGRRKNGSDLPIEIMLSPLESAEGILVTAAIRDTTERKRAEDEILKLNRELEEKVAARTSDLLATNKELEAFTYSVSHDLRAPLRHVDGFSRLLQEEHGKELSADGQEYLSTIRNAVLRMGLLIDDLLSLARVGRTELSVRETGLNSLAEEVVADLKRANPQRAIEWKVETLPFFECDPALMKQVFANLLSNAVRFTRPRKPAEIEVGATGQDGCQVVFVRDNGVGFSMKYADKLFGVFQRLHRAEDFEGTGVGLATVQRIIHKHGGRIWAEAELNKGATFFFMLGTPESRGTES